MHAETMLLQDPAPVLVPGWRTLWSPLTVRMGQLIELIQGRALSVGGVAEIEASVQRTNLSESVPEWVIELFERLALDRTSGPVMLRAHEAAQVPAVCEFLLRLRGPLGLDIEHAPWGIDWSIPDLALRVFIAVPTCGQAPLYEIDRL